MSYTQGLINDAMDEMLKIHAETSRKLENLGAKYNLDGIKYRDSVFKLWSNDQYALELLQKLRNNASSEDVI